MFLTTVDRYRGPHCTILQLRLPHSKVKALIKAGDSEVCTSSSEAAFTMTKATEMFIGKDQTGVTSL